MFFSREELGAILAAVHKFHQSNDMELTNADLKRAMSWAMQTLTDYIQLRQIIAGATVFTVPEDGPVMYLDLEQESQEVVEIDPALEHQIEEILRGRSLGTEDERE